MRHLAKRRRLAGWIFAKAWRMEENHHIYSVYIYIYILYIVYIYIYIYTVYIVYIYIYQ